MQAFAAGGGVGITYQVLLQMGVDSIPGSSDYQQVLHLAMISMDELPENVFEVSTGLLICPTTWRQGLSVHIYIQS